jgi:hypothetical protein
VRAGEREGEQQFVEKWLVTPAKAGVQDFTPNDITEFLDSGPVSGYGAGFLSGMTMLVNF